MNTIAIAYQNPDGTYFVAYAEKTHSVSVRRALTAMAGDRPETIRDACCGSIPITGLTIYRSEAASSLDAILPRLVEQGIWLLYHFVPDALTWYLGGISIDKTEWMPWLPAVTY